MCLPYRLRDLTAESEAELKRKVESMEKELDLSADLQGAPPSSPRSSLTCSRSGPDSLYLAHR